MFQPVSLLACHSYTYYYYWQCKGNVRIVASALSVVIENDILAKLQGQPVGWLAD